VRREDVVKHDGVVAIVAVEVGFGEVDAGQGDIGWAAEEVGGERGSGIWVGVCHRERAQCDNTPQRLISIDIRLVLGAVLSDINTE